MLRYTTNMLLHMYFHACCTCSYSEMYILIYTTALQLHFEDTQNATVKDKIYCASVRQLIYLNLINCM